MRACFKGCADRSLRQGWNAVLRNACFVATDSTKLVVCTYVEQAFSLTRLRSNVDTVSMLNIVTLLPSRLDL